MNHLQEAKEHARKGYRKYDNGSEGYSGLEAQQAQAHALIAIAEQLEKMNDNVTDIGIVNGWWTVEDRLEHAIRKQQEDK